MEKVATIGLDIAKSVFQVHGVDADGEVLIRRRLTRLWRKSFARATALTMLERAKRS